MEIMLYPFMVLAGIGLGLSLFAHVAALLGMEPSSLLFVGLLVGVFVVWIPAMLAANSVTERVSRQHYWKVVFLGCPTWMRYAVYGFGGYAAINFLFFFFSSSSSSGYVGIMRSLSGHWMVFYAAALAAMYAALERKKQGLTLQCPQGHPISPNAHFCEICGKPVHQRRKTRRGRSTTQEPE